jgi:hypothetical protein
MFLIIPETMQTVPGQVISCAEPLGRPPAILDGRFMRLGAKRNF